MSHRLDFIETIRRVIIPRLGLITQFIEDVTGVPLYAESETHNTEFVGRVEMGEEAFEKYLDGCGFERNPLSSWKHLKSTEEHEEASFRKVGFEDFPDYQVHVILYDGSLINNADTGYTYIYAHWEYRWDKHPIKHLKRENYNGPEGVRRMKSNLDQNGLPHEPIRP